MFRGIPDPTNSPPQDYPNPPQLSLRLRSGLRHLLVSVQDELAATALRSLSGMRCLCPERRLVPGGRHRLLLAAPSTGGGATADCRGQFSPVYNRGSVAGNHRRHQLHGQSHPARVQLRHRLHDPVPASLSPNDPWDAEQPLIGAAGQDWTPTQIPTFGRPALFFRALVGSATPQRLWLYAVSISNNCFNCILHGTSEGTSYDIRSTTSLQATNNWAIETNFPGASGQFWTPVSIPMSGRPSLFLSARSWVDSTGSGIPDWWCPVLLRHQRPGPLRPLPVRRRLDHPASLSKRVDPNFYTPPAPKAWAYVTPGGNSRIIQWQATPGPVQNYEA